MCIEFERLMQGYKDKVKGTKTLVPIHRHNIPMDKVAAHIRIVADVRPQKPDPHRIQITVGGSSIVVNYNVGTPTADLATGKILINSTLSTPGARWTVFDLMNMHCNM